jgi:hypothetical protein
MFSWMAADVRKDACPSTEAKRGHHARSSRNKPRGVAMRADRFIIPAQAGIEARRSLSERPLSLAGRLFSADGRPGLGAFKRASMMSTSLYGVPPRTAAKLAVMRRARGGISGSVRPPA